VRTIDRRQLTVAKRFITQVCVWDAADVTWHMWKLDFERPSPSPETSGQGPLPSYDGLATGQFSTHAQHAESEHDDFGTVVTEVTTTSTVTTTRRKYRVEDA